MTTTPTEPARVIDEDRRGNTEWRVERLRVNLARDPATIRTPANTAGDQTRIARWLIYAAIAAVVIALLSLVATAAALWLR
jgi:hypothetical protein